MLRYLFRRLRKNDRGVAFLELAIIIPVLLLLLMGIVEFGWIFNGYITLTGAAREGARVAAVNGNYADAVIKHAESLPALAVNPGPLVGGEEQGDDITVTVTGNLRLLGLLPFFGENLTLPPVEATMRRQYLDETN